MNPRSRRGLLGGLLLFVAVGASGYGLRWLLAPVPPPISYVDADPVVVQVLESAVAMAWRSRHSSEAWGRLGQLLRAHSYYAESSVCLRRAAELDPREPRWPYLYGLNLMVIDPAGAVPFLERAVTLCDGTPEITSIRLAELLLLLGRHPEAEQHFQRVVARDPANARARLGLARVAHEAGRLEEALEHLTPALASSRTRKAAHTALVRLQHERGSSEAARKARSQAEALPPDDPWPDPFLEETRSLMAGKQARLSRLQSLKAQGRYEEMRELAIRLEQDYPDIYWLVEGREERSRGNLKAAEQALQKSVELAPDSVDALFDLGEVQVQRRDYAGAAESFRRLTGLEPNHGPAYVRLGECQLRLGNKPAAILALETALRCDPQLTQAKGLLAEASK